MSSAPLSASGLTVGVITHDRSTFLSELLTHLKVSFETFKSDEHGLTACHLLVINNSGSASHDIVKKIVDASNIADVCSLKIIDSPENNISVGRNLIMENTSTQWLVYVDDDEYPVPGWLSALYEQQQKTGCAVVAGPIEPVYPPSTAGWVAAVDLHNKGKLKTNDRLRRVATGNCLLDLYQVGEQRFDPEFGLSGGSDSLFFDQLAERGLEVVWREDAIVHETIPLTRTSSKYMIFRCMTQGQNFKRVVLRNSKLPQKIVFFIKALVVSPLSITFGSIALPFNSRIAAFWLKRGFTNLGKLLSPSKKLYG